MTAQHIFEKACAAIVNTTLNTRSLHESDSLVDDLGFDSMRMATLSIALETEFDQVLLLNDWTGAVDDPSHLTVGSLVSYLAAVLSDCMTEALEAEYALSSVAQ